MELFSEAAEGIRTLDLLHGKQSVPRRIRMNMPANRQFLGPWRLRGIPEIYRETTGVPGPKPDRAWHLRVRGSGESGRLRRHGTAKMLPCVDL
jgi:hypothetical protein